jgi:hypothetical protein
MAGNEHALGDGQWDSLRTEIVGNAGEWRISHDGKAPNVYETKESAFEAAVATASLALRQGHEVRITVPGGETASGAANAG